MRRQPEHISQILSRFQWRHQYDPVQDELNGQLAATINDEPTLTQQHFAESADINVLARRFGLDKGPIPPVALNPDYFGDLSDVPDLRTALDIINDAREKFNQLDPKLRGRFHNSMAELWDFIHDPDNADEAVRLGLLFRPPDPTAKGPEKPAPNTPLDGVSTST